MLQKYEAKGYDGGGIGAFNDFGAVDIDNCIDTDGLPNEFAMSIMGTMASYTELSPSGRGIRIIFKAPGFVYDKKRFYINNPKLGLEVYIAGCTQKFVTVTGNAIMDLPVEDRSSEIADVLEEYMLRPAARSEPNQGVRACVLGDTLVSDDEIIKKALAARNGPVFDALYRGDTSGYASHSEADMAFCNMLAFWTNRDANQMDRIFRGSGLMRDKWDRAQSGSTYGAITIQEAIGKCQGGYDPQEYIHQRAIKKAEHISIGNGDNKKQIADLHPEKNDRYGWHDIGNGNLFADWYVDVARYVPERKKWFIYDGRAWRPDEGTLRAMELCKRIADNLMIYALSLPDEQQRQAYVDFVKRWQRRAYRETILKDAAGVYPVEIGQFDKNPYLFNCLNGTLNLETGELLPHRAADMLSKTSNVNYVPGACCPRWERFVDEVMQGDSAKAAFLQKALGYALTGDTKHECFFILYGPTSRNGKGTTMETFMRMMGEYGRTAKPDTIAQKQTANGSGPSEDIARLAGARFVNIPEPDKKLVLSASLVKTLTGNDTITARFLNENSFEYRPQFKLFINTNHLPAVTDVTLFSSGRVMTIPFERHFKEEERDEGLKIELAQPKNLSSILNWCVQGLNLLRENGFDPPEAVQIAIDDYRKNSDKIARFLDEEMEAHVLYEARTADVYARYKQWCSANGFFPENAANFKVSLSGIGQIVQKRPAGSGRDASPVSLFLGYRLKHQFEPDYYARNYQ
ncbi:MAG: phage/plasmid primase, P4 family [Bacillota bacterium]